jgi:hypothetical protein
MTPPKSAERWYHQPMMWLVITPPVASVIAGIITAWLILQNPEADVRVPHPTAAVIHGNAQSSVVPPAE